MSSVARYVVHRATGFPPHRWCRGYRSRVTSEREPDSLVAAPWDRLLAPRLVRRLELHAARAHAHGTRTVRDLGDAILLYDPVERDPFLTRVSGLRLRGDAAAVQRRLGELFALFASMDRRPHVWLSPRFHAPANLGQLLRSDGFEDIGGTYTMTMDDPAPVTPNAGPAGVRIERLGSAGRRRSVVLEGAVRVMREAFEADAQAEAGIAADLARTSDAGWDVCLASLDGVAVAAGRRFTADRMTYLSSIGTRPAWRGRGFGTAVTSTLAADGRQAGGEIVHLAVQWQNTGAQRVYRRLGFRVLGDRVADLLL